MAATPTGATIDQTRIRAFTERVHSAAQQKKSRLRDKSIIKFAKGKDLSYDGMGSVEVTDANARFAKLDFSDVAHNRRQVIPNRWQCVLPFDGKDELESLFSIENEYEKVVAAAMMRQFDKTGMDALLADVQTGENFTTTVTAAADGVLTVDATAGLTYDSLLEINENYIDNDLMIDMDVSEAYLALTGKEHTSLMKEQELTSGDYSREFYVEKGAIQKAAGLGLIKYAANATNSILTDDGTNRSCVSFTEGALCYVIQKEIEMEVRKLDDYVNTYAAIITGSFGAVRTEGKRVQLVDTLV